MAKLPKGNKMKEFFKKSGHLLIVSNQLTKFQVPDSNTYIRYLADKFERVKFSKGPQLQEKLTDLFKS